MTLREKQSAFALLVAGLILKADRLGLAVTFGETYRSPEEAARLAKAGKGIRASLHTSRLAVDLHFFRDGVLLTEFEDHLTLGEWWEAQSGDGVTCAWGGRFSSVDSGHFSLEHEGRR